MVVYTCFVVEDYGTIEVRNWIAEAKLRCVIEDMLELCNSGRSKGQQ